MHGFNYVLSLARGFAPPVNRIKQTPAARVLEAARHAPGARPSLGPRSRPPARSVR